MWPFDSIFFLLLSFCQTLMSNPVRDGNREESGDHPGDHKLLTCKDAPADIQVSYATVNAIRVVASYCWVQGICFRSRNCERYMSVVYVSAVCTVCTGSKGFHLRASLSDCVLDCLPACLFASLTAWLDQKTRFSVRFLFGARHGLSRYDLNRNLTSLRLAPCVTDPFHWFDWSVGCHVAARFASHWLCLYVVVFVVCLRRRSGTGLWLASSWFCGSTTKRSSATPTPWPPMMR